jgi:membrane fusion protein (multidrug efflux system)
VLVLDGKNKVQQRKIKTSRLIGSRWLVTDGLAAGDRVIVQGMEKAIPGATVKPRRVTIGAAKSSHPIAKGG